MATNSKSLCALLMASSLILVGCASKSSNIQAQYVSELQYDSLSCDQIQREIQRVNSRVSQISAKQDSDATQDAVVTGVGAILFLPALFLLAATDDQKAEIGRLKGEAEALQRANLKKSC